jgi:hypothetical protein
MEMEMIGMNIYQQFYFHIEPPIKLKLIIPLLVGIWVTSIITYKISITI